MYKLRKAEYGYDCWGSPEFSHYRYIGPFNSLDEAKSFIPRGEYGWEIVKITEKEEIVNP